MRRSLADRLGVRNIILPPLDKKREIERGTHSGFPMCCIRYFMFRCEHMPGWMMELIMPIKNFIRCNEDAQYIRCPKCVVRRHIVKLHECNAGCCGEVGHCPGECPNCKAEIALYLAYAGMNHKV